MAGGKRGTRRVRSRGGLACLALVGLVVGGCDARTELVVVVDSDLEPGVEIATVQVAVSTGASFADTAELDLGEVSLPASFGIVPADDQPAGSPLFITVHALDADRRVALRYRAETAFVHGDVRRLEVPLARACLAVECGEDEVCRRGECEDPFVDPATLLRGAGDDPPTPLFDGPRVAPDAGMPDGGVCVPDAPCELGECARGVIHCDREEPVCFFEEAIRSGDVCEGDGACVEGRCVH